MRTMSTREQERARAVQRRWVLGFRGWRRRVVNGRRVFVFGFLFIRQKHMAKAALTAPRANAADDPPTHSAHESAQGLYTRANVQKEGGRDG
jgi:hypothetical protein